MHNMVNTFFILHDTASVDPSGDRAMQMIRSLILVLFLCAHLIADI